MKINIIEKTTYTIDVNNSDTLLDIIKTCGLKAQLVQVGGPLGEFVKAYDLNKTIDEFDLLENNIMIINSFCPVDLSRFMSRFLIRELNIINQDMKRLNELLDHLTSGQYVDVDYFVSLLNRPYKTLGERLLVRNIKWLYSEYQQEFIAHQNGYCKASICRGLFKAQCINACPAHIHIPGFIALMKNKDYKSAYQLMRQENPLSSVCGSVCARPCEIKCRRGQITGTVGVRALQRFISSEALRSWQSDESLMDKNGYSVGIVGGGPAGLTAAYYLVRSGYDVTVYESHTEAGGMLASGVPKYRLPSYLIREEIDTIENLGVEIKRNFKVDRENYPNVLNAHDRLIIATGTPKGRLLNINHPNVISGIDFLKRLNDTSDYGRRILVVGGGDVALDCARTARRLNAEVTVISLETFDEMPASEEEKQQSIEEGITFKSGYAIDSVDNKHVKLKRCLQVLDEAKVFNPLYETCDDGLETVDTVIFAIGQERDLPFIDGEVNGYEYDDKVFMAGDVIKPTIVIDAIAQGKKVAGLVDKTLNKSGLNVGEPITIPERVLNIRTFDDDLKEVSTLPIKERLLSFDQVNLNYSEEDAAYEAERCMRCDRNSTVSLLLGR